MSAKYLKPRKKTITVSGVVLTCDDCGAKEKFEYAAAHWTKYGCLNGWVTERGSGARFGQTLVMCSECRYIPEDSPYDRPA